MFQSGKGHDGTGSLLLMGRNVLGGSRVVISRVIITIVTPIMTPLLTTHEPPSTRKGSRLQ